MQIKNIKEEKIKLRSDCRKIRQDYSPEKKQALDRSILRRVVGLYQYRSARTLLTYVSKSIEVDTFGLIERAWRDGKRVAVPRCVEGTCLMEFYYITSLDQLEEGSFGVPEPKPDACERMDEVPEGAVCIVPGMSFDCDGFRLGYGKGYYDRFLSGFGGFTVGVCYSDCIRWRLPRGYFDKPVDMLVTDRYFRKIHKHIQKP